MSIVMTDLVEYVVLSTEVYRKGEVVTMSGQVVTIDAFPAQPATRHTVDCHFVTVGFTEHAPSWSHQQFSDAILACPRGEFRDMPLERWQGGPSYIEIGGWIGDQTLALRLMALGQEHDLWDVITPALFGITGAEADVLAGNGLVLVSGIRQPVITLTPLISGRTL